MAFYLVSVYKLQSFVIPASEARRESFLKNNSRCESSPLKFSSLGIEVISYQQYCTNYTQKGKKITIFCIKAFL